MQARILILLVLVAAALPGCLGSEDDPAPSTPTAPAVPDASPADHAEPEDPATPADAPAAPPPPQQIGPYTFVYALMSSTNSSVGFDNASRVEVVAWLNASAQGVYVVPSGVTSETGIGFYPPSSDVLAAHHVEWDLDAGVADAGATVQGPWESTLEAPESGSWRLSHYGLAENVQAEMVLTIYYD